jgi:hypothetical protein
MPTGQPLPQMSLPVNAWFSKREAVFAQRRLALPHLSVAIIFQLVHIHALLFSLLAQT